MKKTLMRIDLIDVSRGRAEHISRQSSSNLRARVRSWFRCFWRRRSSSQSALLLCWRCADGGWRTLIGLASTGFLLLVLIGLWDRHEQEITGGLSRIYERYLASQAGPSSNPRARAAIEAERAGAGGRGRQVTMTQTFQAQPKLVGTGAVGSANQGMSVALSADGNTAIVGGPGANNADRDRPPSVGPAGAAWVFTRSGGLWRQQAKLVGATSEYGGGLWPQGTSVAVSARPRRCRRACPSQIRNRVVRLRVPWNAFGEVQCLDNFIDVAFAPAVGIDRPSLERIGRVALDQIHMPGIG